MRKTYLTHSPVAWISLALIVIGFSMKWIVTATGLPIWMVPVGYFVALAGAAALFIGWVRWAAKVPSTTDS
jgi:hypothetical protein